MATYSSILAWKILGLRSLAAIDHRVAKSPTELSTHTLTP